MPNYVNFRDVGAVIAAGGKLQTAGITLDTRIRTDYQTLKDREGKAISQRDEYGKTFWSGTYAVENRNTNIYTKGLEWADRAKLMGTDVIDAARQMLWIDALSGAAIAEGNRSA